jgi:hypothetical protein
VIGLAFVPYAVAYWHANRYNWTPLDERVELHRGGIRTRDFVVEVDGTYVLFLEVQPRRMDSQRLTCLLDLEMLAFKENCAAIPPVVDTSWSLSSAGRVIADNNSEQTWKAGSYSNDSLRREIGRFRARRGERCVLEVEFHRDPSELNIANPKLVAEVIQDWEGFAIETQASFALGILAALVGVLLISPVPIPRLDDERAEKR